MMTGIFGLRPFLPARDFSLSRRFYEALGFRGTPLGNDLALIQYGTATAGSFFLQRYYVKEFAENLMLQLLVEDLDAFWRHIDNLALDAAFGVQPPRAPVMQPWGLRVAYLFDPAGVLWHLVEDA